MEFLVEVLELNFWDRVVQVCISGFGLGLRALDVKHSELYADARMRKCGIHLIPLAISPGRNCRFMPWSWCTGLLLRVIHNP